MILQKLSKFEQVKKSRLGIMQKTLLVLQKYFKKIIKNIIHYNVFEMDCNRFNFSNYNGL